MNTTSSCTSSPGYTPNTDTMTTASVVPTLDTGLLRLLAIGAQADISLVSARYRIGSVTETEATISSRQSIALIALVGSELDRRLQNGTSQ